MYQSVMSQRQGTGSSGVGYAFDLVVIKELLPDKNICLAESLQYGTQYQLGLDKRGQISWPQTGDQWVIDRSMGHWALCAKITGTRAPSYTGFSNLMDPDTYRLVQLLTQLGLVVDDTTANGVSPAPPAITGSVANLPPILGEILNALDEQGIVSDQTTPVAVAMDTWQPVVLTNGFTGYTGGTDDVTVRYKINYDNTVTVEGRATPPGSVANGVAMFTIATGYRPPIPKYQTTIVANGVAGTIVYGKDGVVGLYDFGATTPTRVLFHARYSLV